MRRLIALGAAVLVLAGAGTAFALTRGNGPGPFASQQAPGVAVCLPSKTATVTGQGPFRVQQPTTINSVRLEHDKGIRLLGFKLTGDPIGSANGWTPGPAHSDAHSIWLAFGLERTAKSGQEQNVEITYTVGGTQYQWSDPVAFSMQRVCSLS